MTILERNLQFPPKYVNRYFQEVLYELVRGENFKADLSRWRSGFG